MGYLLSNSVAAVLVIWESLPFSAWSPLGQRLKAEIENAPEAANACAELASTHRQARRFPQERCSPTGISKLTWPALGEDPAARSHRVDQFTAPLTPEPLCSDQAAVVPLTWRHPRGTAGSSPARGTIFVIEGFAARDRRSLHLLRKRQVAATGHFAVPVIARHKRLTMLSISETS